MTEPTPRGGGYRTLNDRYLRTAEARADGEFRIVPDMDAARVERLRLPSYMQQPARVHLVIMEAVDRLLTRGLTDPDAGIAPIGLRTLVRSMRRFEPMMLEELAKVPEEECIKMMRALGSGILDLADTVDGGKSIRVLDADPGAAEPPPA